jgi:hypothetical protein
MATAYNPAANPYILNTLELPANQVAANAVPAWNVSTTQWCQSPSYLPLWGDESQGPQPPPYGPAAGPPAQGPAQALQGVATASVVRPDASINAREAAANISLQAEKQRQTTIYNGSNSAITAINAIVTNPVVVQSCVPSVIPHGVATNITIQGADFTGVVAATGVTIGGLACTNVVLVSPGLITATSPAASVAGPANVVVVATAGTGTLTNGVTYT